MTSRRAGALVRRAAPAVGLLLLAASLVVGTDVFGAREAIFGSATPAARNAAFSRVDSSPSAQTDQTVLRSQAWWQEVRRLRGAGLETVRAPDIGDDAIQWRLRWRCSRGRLVMRDSADAAALVDASCPGTGSREFTEPVGGPLEVEADGRWTARVEQQVDVPLVEPPLPAMTARGTTTVARGAFYRIDEVGRGRVAIYRLPSGRHALRLEDFYVTPNIDLEIRLSPLRGPRTSRQYLSTPATLAAPLDVTAGSMNFVLPRGIVPSRYGSVVIWCPPVQSAYAAATLERQ